MADRRNRGRQGFNAAGDRGCRRCGRDISARHGNAIYCGGCSGKRSKPHVYSVRLSRETHERLLRLVQESGEKRVQPILEAIIKAALEDS
jgi:phosphatidylethanolamine-binding protein (PEBP) family uncharacterized protein